ncbi:membrane-associated protein [Chitinophaga costaii]|uniref:Membrane-associated protein n=1 Tax=Chitinophaga costaii TaxID=1335309 RepID=A0A1C3ZSB4_9BACT|nr:VTT domain-containing protein [Chitinophaga costaii]PUZ30483.1 alkaline phosphatase [Chitinophaga costaii]SCB85274.1 membrane-associated protein [Chitinophaga costaii]
MHQIIELFKELLDPKWIIGHGGFYLLILIIFAETGLFVGFFLPGDSLLFIAGFYGKDIVDSLHGTPLFVVMVLVALGGVLGNYVGYWFGRKSGPLLFSRKDTFFFKKKHLYQAKEFFEKYGGGAIFLARFLPIVRTFAPIVAGIVQMDSRRFMIYNLLGSFSWVFSMMSIGYFLGRAFPELEHRLDIIIVILILITTLPVILKLIFGKTKPINPS